MKARAILEAALEQKQFSAAGFYCRHGKEQQEFYLGTHAEKDSLPVDSNSLFDLASLTKILSTMSLLFSAESEGKVEWEDPIQKYFSSLTSSTATILDLATHRSGLPAHLEFFRRYEKGDAKFGDQKNLLSWICEAGLPTVGQQVYSDLGFMLLGLLLESLYGKTLPELFYERMTTRFKLAHSGFVVLPNSPAPARLYGLLAPKAQFIATEDCPWRKKIIQGEVHDDNCWALGGYAGHAGLFANVRETSILFDHLWKQASVSPAFLKRKHEAPGIFSYGFMTYPGLRPFPGPAFEGSLGHTGFVGTSAWRHEKSNTQVVLLTNRVHPKRSDDRFVQTRLEFHKALWADLGL